MRTILTTLVVIAVALTACDDAFGPTFWDPTPDTIEIYSVSRLELLGLPSAFDAITLRRVAVEDPSATGTWDFALAEENGSFVMVPAGAFDGLDSRAAIATIGQVSLVDLAEAPSDTSRFESGPVAISPGTVYVLRTRREACPGFGLGVRYAKLEALAVDPAAGSFRFAVIRNPFCNDRSLIPPEED